MIILFCCRLKSVMDIKVIMMMMVMTQKPLNRVGHLKINCWFHLV